MVLLPRWLLTVSMALAIASDPLYGQPSHTERPPFLPGTQPLEFQWLDQSQDIARKMLDGIDRFLLQAIQDTKQKRWQHWRELTSIIEEGRVNGDGSLPPGHRLWIEQQRDSLRECLGLRDQRLPFSDLEILCTTQCDGVVGRGEILRNESESATDGSPSVDHWQAMVVRWPVLNNVFAEGLFIEPAGGEATASVVVIPDADQTPEQVAGLEEGLPDSLQIARILASNGCRVIVPTLISRTVEERGPPGETGRAELSSREFVYRPAFELGRHIVGYEVHKVLAAVDWLSKEHHTSIGVAGYGEGGLIGLLCAALDDRVDAALVKGAFGPREGMWREPICRNLFGFLKKFGDAELAAMVWPRGLVVDFRPGPIVHLKSRGGAPGELIPPSLDDATGEFRRAAAFLGIDLVQCDPDTEPPIAAVLCGPFSAGQAAWIPSGLRSASDQEILTGSVFAKEVIVPAWLRSLVSQEQPASRPQPVDTSVDVEQRQRRQVGQLIEHTQFVLAESAKHRDQLLKGLDTSSIDNYRESTEPHRRRFYEEVIGRFEIELLPLNARSRLSWQSEKWTGYEVMLDVWKDVIAYGILLMPDDIAVGEKRPVVVCQHGLEGRPTDVFLGDHPAYRDFAAKLCQRGYIVFAPQNPYLMEDRFRTLQRKANSIGRSLFSIIIPQHEQILRWLQTLPQVDSERIAFYGLSYGGKSAMRIPAILEDYCLSICSADFNEWIIKNASTRDSFSYVWTGEYEIFEYNLGNTFGYAEMASLICPRPFMVERGHFDAVATDQWVGFEYAKVRNLYQARLGIGDLTEIEWFPGPHTINGKGTFEFLDRHLLHSPPAGGIDRPLE